MDETYKKVTMVDQIAISVSSPKNYKELTKLKVGKTVQFTFLMVFVLAFMQIGISIICFLLQIGGFKNLIMNKIPAFSYEQGSLEMENEMCLAVGDVIIYANPDYDKIQLTDLEDDGVYIAFGKENVVMGMLNGGNSYLYGNYQLSDIFPVAFDNEKLCSLIPIFYVYIILFYISGMIGITIRWLFMAFVFSLIGRVIANNFNTRLEYGNVFRICIYGQTLAMLLSAANVALDYFISSTFMFIISLIISFVFINKGIVGHIKSPGTPPNRM